MNYNNIGWDSYLAAKVEESNEDYEYGESKENQKINDMDIDGMFLNVVYDIFFENNVLYQRQIMIRKVFLVSSYDCEPYELPKTFIETHKDIILKNIKKHLFF